ncbi:MAG: DctP family TRAP transporter solute-binding subunit [Firmicutes bacterium]|nr:DctP family TRAP transporter solute-binding subunit [Bacillota bacterium]
MSRRVVAVLLVVSMCLTVALAGCGSKPAEQKPAEQKPAEQKPAPAADQAKPAAKYNWKMNVSTPDPSTWTRGARKFADLVKERSSGNLVITVYSNEQLSGGNQPKGIEMVQSGATEFDIHSSMIWSVVEPKVSAVSLPFMFKNTSEVEKALNGKAGEMLKQALEAKGVHFLAWGENGFRQLTTSKKAVAKVADLKGLKIRIPTINMLISVFKAFGADPTVMNGAEVFTALQQGTIDGQENPLGIIDSLKFYEVQKYITMWNYSYDPIVLTVNKKLWDSLDQGTQKILADAAKDAMAWQIATTREEDKTYLKRMQDKGVQVIYPTPEALAEFQKAAEPVYAEIEKAIGKELIEAFKAKQ